MAGATYSAHLFYSDSVSLVGVKGTECASSFESAVAELAREDTLNDIRVATSRRRGIGVPDTTNKILIERHADLGRLAPDDRHIVTELPPYETVMLKSST